MFYSCLKGKHASQTHVRTEGLVSWLWARRPTRVSVALASRGPTVLVIWRLVSDLKNYFWLLLLVLICKPKHQLFMAVTLSSWCTENSRRNYNRSLFLWYCCEVYFLFRHTLQFILTEKEVFYRYKKICILFHHYITLFKGSALMWLIYKQLAKEHLLKGSSRDKKWFFYRITWDIVPLSAFH